jgi:hypothetical protein
MGARDFRARKFKINHQDAKSTKKKKMAGKIIFCGG